MLMPPIAGDRVPTTWPDDVVAATLQRRLALRLPDAKVVHADPETVAAARTWLARFEPRAVLSLRVERAYCGDTLEGRPLRHGLAAGRGRDPGRHAAPVRPGSARRSWSRAWREAASPRWSRARSSRRSRCRWSSRPGRARSRPAHGRTAWTAAAVRTLFPGLGQRIEAELLTGRSRARERPSRARRRRLRARGAHRCRGPRRARLSRGDALDARAREADPAGLALADARPRWSPSQRASADTLLADERRRRDELLALLAVLDEDLRVPPASTLATLPLVEPPAAQAFGPALARERAGGEIEARAVYAPDGSVLSRYFFARGAPLPVLREEDTSQDGRPDRWIGYQDGTRREIWEDGRGRGRPDVHLVFAAEGEPLERIELDDDGDGKPERVFSYTLGKLTGESRDTNRDGRLDRFDRLRRERRPGAARGGPRRRRDRSTCAAPTAPAAWCAGSWPRRTSIRGENGRRGATSHSPARHPSGVTYAEVIPPSTRKVAPFT